MSNKWTDKEVEILKKMLDAGKTADEIAQVIKSRTLDGIRNKAGHMGWKFYAVPEFDMDAFNKIMKGK
jgi:hypothetical protein